MSTGPCNGITIRPIRAEDKGLIVEAFRGLEPRSIYLRFFFDKKELSDAELRRLTEPDKAREAVLVATIPTGNGERIVGLGRYTGNEECAQLAFTVEEDFQGRGIATRLLGGLIQLARASGISRFEAHVLAGNGPMLSVLRHSGLPATEREKDGIVTVTLALNAMPPSNSDRNPTIR
ncbi:MAG TPA: GNAT family N-acetyltransferase [Burkholderiales bacterium]|nr:GNAT family N-acetyltransferase [Burkholderiales bacterium]